jgi:hypothetical protein
VREAARTHDPQTHDPAGQTVNGGDALDDGVGGLWCWHQQIKVAIATLVKLCTGSSDARHVHFPEKAKAANLASSFNIKQQCI